jgi:hypothetical protein
VKTIPFLLPKSVDLMVSSPGAAMLGSMKDSETVFRSADPSAQEDAAAVLELLTSQGISGDLVDDTTHRAFLQVCGRCG